MSVKRLMIIGYTGRVGCELRELAPEFGFKVMGGVSTRAVHAEESVQVVRSIGELSAEQTDVVIDFSLPEATDGVLDWCARNGKPLVSGVTGISDAQKLKFQASSQIIPVLWAPNMSIGVAVLARMLTALKYLEGFDFQIEELHHNRKKDKPSGTALMLQERLKAATSAAAPEPLAIRGGGIFGIHRIWAMGEEELITLEHTAMNRRVFARGALRAAQWILGRPPAMYRIDDLLGN